MIDWAMSASLSQVTLFLNFGKSFDAIDSGNNTEKKTFQIASENLRKKSQCVKRFVALK